MQLPLPVHTNVHGACDCHAPALLQTWGAPLTGSQRVLPGTHSPPHAVPTQANGHAVPARNCPWSLQVCSDVSVAHRVAPGAHSPVQASPTQAF